MKVTAIVLFLLSICLSVSPALSKISSSDSSIAATTAPTDTQHNPYQYKKPSSPEIYWLGFLPAAVLDVICLGFSVLCPPLSIILIPVAIIGTYAFMLGPNK